MKEDSREPTPGRPVMLLGSSAFLELHGVLGSLGAHLLSCKKSTCNPGVKEKRKTGFFLHCLLAFRFDGDQTLLVKIYRASGGRIEYCVESESSGHSCSFFDEDEDEESLSNVKAEASWSP